MNQVRERANTTLEHLSFGWRGRHGPRLEVPAIEDEREYDEDEDDEAGAGGMWLFFWGALTALAVWWLYLRPVTTERKLNTLRANARPGRRPGSRPANAVPQQNRAQQTEPMTEAAEGEVEGGDDLTAIWGIGPARAARLREAGISTFGALAVADAEQLRDILAGVGVGAADSTTWPEQASLAAKGEWDSLAAFQDRIREERA